MFELENTMITFNSTRKVTFSLLLHSVALLSIAQTVLPGNANNPAKLVNVFLGTSGDHGQLSPAASYPFGLLSIGPQTYPHLHAGYEHKAKRFLGFTHNRFEGVGCMGSGGNILIKPFFKTVDDELLKRNETAEPGFYQVDFSNGIQAAMAVLNNAGVETYTFAGKEKRGIYIDLSHSLANRFVAEEHAVGSNSIGGWIESGTTCNQGVYRIYFHLALDNPESLQSLGEHAFIVWYGYQRQQVQVRIALSSVDVAHAAAAINRNDLTTVRTQARAAWNDCLKAITVQGNAERTKLFYSLLYRTLQSPYVISEKDGSFRSTNGSISHSTDNVYNGWSVWDNYRTQLPLLSLLYPNRYAQIAGSIARLYAYGKKNYATQHEPSNTVRTEHAIVVLLDAWRKGYAIDFRSITDSLIAEGQRLDYSSPDKALEASYDAWALAQVLASVKQFALADTFMSKAKEYKNYWNKDFKDISKPDVDKMQARKLYQGTIWQYRWLVPFDVKGLKELTGAPGTFSRQLDYFFEHDLYNHANEIDIQAPLLYNATAEPWKSQALVHKYAVDTVVQYYFNDNSRGIDPFVDVIYKNQPEAYIRTMDDDGGAMSGWFAFAASGFMPACVGWPVYYLHVPLFNSVKFNWPGKKPFVIKVENQGDRNCYIAAATLNGKPLQRNWITHEEIMQGGTLLIKAGDQPNKTWGVNNSWISSIEMK